MASETDKTTSGTDTVEKPDTGNKEPEAAKPTPLDVAKESHKETEAEPEQENEDRGFPLNTPETEMTAEQRAAYERFNGRKHEKAEKKARAELEEAQRVLNQTKAENAKLSLRLSHPEVPRETMDKILALSTASDADSIKEWGEKAVQVFAGAAPTQPTNTADPTADTAGEKPKPITPVSDVAKQAYSAGAVHAPKPAHSTFDEAYKSAQEKLKRH